MSELSQIVVTDANGIRRHVNYALEGDGSLTRTTLLAGSTEDLRGKLAGRPAADAVLPGTTFWAVDALKLGQPDQQFTVSDGETWEPV